MSIKQIDRRPHGTGVLNDCDAYQPHGRRRPRLAEIISPEEWRTVPGYGEKYEASSHGRVRVAATGQIKKQWLHRGYPCASVYWKKRGTRRVHQLVAAAFRGPCPDGLEVRHLDGIRTNNVPSNLTYGTHYENIQDIKRHGNTRNAHTDKTHCIRGHEFTPENTWASPTSGKRACLACNKLRLDAKRAGVPFPKPPTPPNPKREMQAA